MPQIIFIRHAEKPHDHSDSHLSHKGSRRAHLLVDYILHPWAGELRVPRRAYVMVMDRRKSQRCKETMGPTLKQAGDMLPCEYVHRFRGTELARRLSMSSKDDSIVCWEHGRIVDMLNVMGAGVRSWGLDPESSDPRAEDSKRCFDATWVVDVTLTHVRLRVYRQFDVVDDEAVWRHDRNHVWFDRTYLKHEAGHVVLPRSCVVM